MAAIVVIRRNDVYLEIVPPLAVDLLVNTVFQA